MDIQVAGLIFHIENRDPRLERLFTDFLVSGEEAGRVPEAESIPLPPFPPEEHRHPNLPRNLPEFQQDLNELIADVHEALTRHGGMILHAAAVEADGRGYLFTAPPGTGKSTHISYWMKYLPTIGKTCSVICGDKPAVRKIGGAWNVCGTPWKGKEGWGGRSVCPVEALCVLTRGKENSIVPVSSEEMLPRMLTATYYPETEEQMRRQLDILEDFMTSVHCYRLSCNLSVDAARTAWEGLRHRE